MRLLAVLGLGLLSLCLAEGDDDHQHRHRHHHEHQQHVHAGVTKVDVTIDPKTSFGTWRGWGTSLAWFGAALGDRGDVADVLFTRNDVEIVKGTTVPGLGLNMARYNAGASSWNTIDGGKEKMVQSPNIHRDRQVEAFWIDPTSADPASNSWNWSVDANQIKLMQNAQSRGADIFQLFSNSPVWWQCKNKNPSGSASGVTDNLGSDQYTNHAVYLATVAEHAKKTWGITFESVEAFNEPSSGWWVATGTQEGCHFDATTQAAVIPLLRQELDRRNLSSMWIAASDENSYSLALSSFNTWNSAAKKLVDLVDVHGYELTNGPREQLYAAVVQGAGKRLINSEYGEGDDSGATLASCLNLDLNRLHPTVWTYWQAFDGGGWGLVQSDIPNKQPQQVNRKYYVLLHYTRHIRPNCSIVQTNQDNTVAAYCPGDQTLVIVTYNPNDGSEIYTYDLTRFAHVNPQGAQQRWETDIGKGSRLYSNFTDVVVSQGTVQVDIPGHSIETIEITNVS